MIKPMNGKDFEREFQESTAKKLLEDYKDFQKKIIPVMVVYSSKTKDVHKSVKITAMIEACEILNKQLKEYFNKKRNYSYKELEEKNENFADMMTNLQRFYQNVIIELESDSGKNL